MLLLCGLAPVSDANFYGDLSAGSYLKVRVKGYGPSLIPCSDIYKTTRDTETLSAHNSKVLESVLFQKRRKSSPFW